MVTWEDIEPELLRRTAKTIWCTLATVDPRGRPRTRIVHPVWCDGQLWLTTRTGTPKLADIGRTPAVSVLWWDPDHEQVTVDGTATVHTDDATRSQAWEVCRRPPEPYGFDPGTIWPAGPTDPACTIVRIVPEQISLFGRPPVVWRRTSTATGRPACSRPVRAER